MTTELPKKANKLVTDSLDKIKERVKNRFKKLDDEVESDQEGKDDAGGITDED
jgi:hypothetical protein